MLAGFGGHLIAEAFLEQAVQHAPPVASAAAIALWRRQCARLGPASGLRAILEIAAVPLLSILGHDRVSSIEYFNDAVVATLSGISPPALLLVASWNSRLDPFWRRAVVEACRRDAAWALLFNGTHLRLIDARRLSSRRYVELDLTQAVCDSRSLAALDRIFHGRSLDRHDAAHNPFELMLDASDRHRAGVSRSLKDGVLTASREVLAAITRGKPAARLDDTFDQALTLVYRLLFLLFAEARSLVPIWHPVYRESYSLEAMRESAERGPTPGLWDAFRAISRLAHAGCHMGDLKVTPFNGRLFSPSRTPLAERRDLDDDAARRAVLALSTRPAVDRTTAERIVYRDLGVEQLGSVYETLLDYQPRRVAMRSGGDKTSVALEPGSGVRKATGTFYTPLPIAQYLVRRTLGPLVRNRTPEEILRLRVLDPAMGSGAFLVAACGFLADAYEGALVDGGRCHAADIGPAERAAFRRTIAERCLYGVDLNPMAVQLARLSLWLATLAADKPLGFLDHHLRAGDSLLGVWLSNLRQPPIARARRTPGALPLFDDDTASDALRTALPVRFALTDGPSDTPEQVHGKERALAALEQADSSLSRWKSIADIWCAWWFGLRADPKAFPALSDRVLGTTSILPDAVASRLIDEALSAVAPRRLFHWELEFPEVFFDADGRRLASPGFDAIVGNPPWDMVRADDRREGSASRTAVQSVTRFTRDTGTYAHQSDGHANRYQLFVERSVMLARSGGRIGLVLPGGMISDHGSAPLRKLLFNRCDVDAVVSFENRKALFPIHRSVRFILATATSGTPTTRIACRLGETDADVLDRDDDATFFPIHVTPALLERLTGDGLAIPELKTPLDLAIAERAAVLFQPLGHRDGWHVRFGRELNASDDRQLFRSAGKGLPVVEGKALHPFTLHTEGIRYSVTARDAERQLGSRHLRPRLAYRDVASATNRTTLIAAILPARCVSTHTLFCLRTPLDLRAQHCLCGLFNSLVVNYLTRQRVTSHVTTAIVEQLPVPSAAQMGATLREIAALSRLLTKRTCPEALARLNAVVARLYQLTREEFAHVLSTFPLVPVDEREAAFREFCRLRSR